MKMKLLFIVVGLIVVFCHSLLAETNAPATNSPTLFPAQNGSNKVASFSLEGEFLGIQLTVFLSKSVVRQGEPCSVVFELKNTTNRTVRLLNDVFGLFHVQADPDLGRDRGNQIACLYGRIDPMPEACYLKLKPGETVSHSYPILTDPAKSTTRIPPGFWTNAAISAVRMPDGTTLCPFGTYLPEPGVHKIVVRGIQGTPFALDLAVVER